MGPRDLVGVFLCLAITAWSGGPARAQSLDYSLRIGTYNAYLMSPAGKCPPPNPASLDCLSQIAGETEEWARRLARLILDHKDDLDIVVINEAWDEDAKQILVDFLHDTYPIHVKKIDRFILSSSIKLEDSGLMLFAKQRYSVVPLPDPEFKWGRKPTESLDATTEEVAFGYFGPCKDDDCLAAKGAGLIRLKDSESEHIYDVVFTHTQADYPPNDIYISTRLEQFRIIERMVKHTLPHLDDRLAGGTETVIMAGDLNVPRFRTHAEYDDRFTTQGSFFTLPLYEAWGKTTSPKDHTRTNVIEDERLDYILASPAPFSFPSRTAPVCVQHLTVPVDFVELESDHNMVHADINIGGYHCNPSLARAVVLSESDGLITVDKTSQGVEETWLIYPGQMQWLRIDASAVGAATYSLTLDNSDLDFDVYLPENLTTPVARQNKTSGAFQTGSKTIRVDQYVLPESFYIRIHGKTRSAKGNYSFGIKRHTCATKSEACILTPGVPMGARLSPTTGDLEPQNEAWFRFDAVGEARSGEKQTLTLNADVVAPSRVTAGLDSFTNTSSGTLAKTSQGTKVTFQGKAGDGSTGYLVIKQSSRGVQPTRVKASLATNMRFLTVRNLVCIDETNPELGSDDIFSVFKIDGDTLRAPHTGSIEFDCDNTADTKAWATWVGTKTLKFVDKVSVKLLEDDDLSPNDKAHVHEVPDLRKGETYVENRHLAWHFEGGEYRFFYDLRMRPNEPYSGP